MKNFKKVLFVALAIVAIFLTVSVNNAMASEVPTGGQCDNFYHNWGDNISCVGKFTMADMGAPDENGVWEWDTAFKTLVNDNNFSAWQGDWSEMTPTPNTETVVDWWRVDNKRYPNGDLKHRVAGVEGYTGGIMFPSVWKIKVEDPAGEDNPWWATFPYYPYYVVHVDWNWADDCGSLCDQNGCQFDSGPVTLPLPNTYVCQWNEAGDDDQWDTADDLPMTLYGGVEMDVDGEERLSPENVSHIVLNGQTEYPSYIEHGTFYSMSYNTGNNSQEGSNTPREYRELYFHHYDGLLPMDGEQVAVLHMKNGTEKELTYEVESDRVLPTVAATYEYQVERVNKSGKHILTGQTVTAQNLTARELPDGQLIIQWAEPDGAFQAPLPNTGGIRLRLWVGDMSSTDNLQFLWIDAPVVTGTVVVPVDKWNMIKGLMVTAGRTSVDIGGMYREQFDTFHNRGYIEDIEYTF